MRTIGFYLLFFLSFIGQAWAEVNVNTATASELATLKGVGPATAKKIIEYREANGPFKSCDGLMKIKGIGPKKLNSIKPDCVTGDAGSKKTETKDVSTEPSEETEATEKAETTETAKSTSGGIDVNTATATELEALNGVGPATAKKIVAYREANGPFKSCDGLMKVKGIGPKKMEKFRSQCSVSITPAE